MAFIVQCPHPNCKRFMMLEDHVRGTTVECLVCRKAIQLDPSGSSDRPKPPPLHKAPSASRRAKRQEITNCPNCSTPLRLPPAHAGKSIKCPVCKQLFTA